MSKNILVGAHTSIAKGVYNALLQGQKINASTVQIFTTNQRQWAAKPIPKADIEKFKKLKKETGIEIVTSHNNYLTNLGSAKPQNLSISKKAFAEEIKRCHSLEINYLVFHPGSAVETTADNCLNTIVDSLLSFEGLLQQGKTKLVLETTAGQGSNVGYKFEHLAYIIKNTKSLDLKVCLDTCHIFAAGYDIRTKEKWNKTLKEFSDIIGIDKLALFHLNDSKNELGSRKDRHENIGKGKIGLECFKYIMQEKKFKDIPKYLETPLGNEKWVDEIKLLKKLAG